jgi:hypothetical protein
MRWRSLDLSWGLHPAATGRASAVGRRAAVVLAQPSCQLLRSHRWTPAAALLSGGRVLAGPRSQTHVSRSTPACAPVPIRPADDPEDDAVAGSQSPDWSDRDNPTNAGVQVLPQPPLSRAGDPRRAVTQLDGGMADKLPPMRHGDGGRPSAQFADQGGSGAPVSAEVGRACSAGRVDDDSRHPFGPT